MSDLPGIDPDLLGLPSLRAALAERDISRVYRILTSEGISQRTIAAATGQAQSEVCEILKGRQVMAYDVLVRICEGLGIPRGTMGLAYDEAEPADVGEVDEDMKRRALMAAAGVALFGAPVLGELLEIPTRPPSPTPLPSRLAASDVTAMRNLTTSLRGVARTHGGCGEPVSSVAARSRILMTIPAADQVRAGMASALAELHTLAGWTCVDSGHHDNAMANFAAAMELAAAADDALELASAFRHAGIQMIDAGADNDGLKAFQLGVIKLGDSPSSPGAASALAWLDGESALPLAALGQHDAAIGALARARERSIDDPFDDADMDFLTSCVYRRLGRPDVAERFAASSVRKWDAEGCSRRDSAEAVMALAELHAAAGELDSVALAQRAIDSVAPLRSVRARQRLTRLAAVLETRPRSDFVELARRARQVAGVQV